LAGSDRADDEPDDDENRSERSTSAHRCLLMRKYSGRLIPPSSAR
jgi:hypothetical protein